ncbi:MAG: chemotaxis protein CheB, partial [Alcaligenaceae bacterium]
EIKRHGGKSVVQSPSDAQAPEMPVNAILRDNPDHVVMLDRIGPLLRQLVGIST